MAVEISWLGVVLATLSTMVVGSVWYMPSVFGRTWEKLVGMTEKKKQKGATKAISLTVVVSFITAYVLAYFTFIANEFFQNSFLQDALMTALWLWLGLVAARMITHDLFEQRPEKLTLMNVAHELVTLLVMGLIIGLLAP